WKDFRNQERSFGSDKESPDLHLTRQSRVKKPEELQQKEINPKTVTEQPEFSDTQLIIGREIFHLLFVQPSYLEFYLCQQSSWTCIF
ncbi:hypothetical protein KI387_003925, partial [Taxus chinensis]